MTRTLLLWLALTACASAQMMPFGFWKTTSAAPAVWTPKSFGDSLYLWVSADSIADKAPGDTLYTWRDLSGRGNHMYQLTAGKKPIMRDSAGALVVFDGVDDAMVAGTIPLLAQPTTIVFIGTFFHATDNFPTPIDGLYSTNRNTILWADGSPSPMYVYAGTFNATTVSVPTSKSVIIGVFNGASSYIRALNTTSAGTNSGTQSLSGLIVGTNFLGNGQTKISAREIVVLHRVITASEITALESYSAAKWGTP